MSHIHIFATIIDTAPKPLKPVVWSKDNFLPEHDMALDRNATLLPRWNDSLSQTYPWGFNPHHIHIFVDIPRTPSSFAAYGIVCADGFTRLDENEVPELPEYAARRRHMNYKPKAPSEDGQPKEFAKIQEDPVIAVECGRPLNRESPIPASLYDEILCKLQHDLQFAEPTPVDKIGFQELREALVGFFTDEAARKQKVQEVLVQVLGHDQILSSALNGRTDKELKYKTDGDTWEKIEELQEYFMLFLKEIRNEITGNTTEPFLQAICCYRAQLFQLWAKDKNILSNYPAIILMQFGAWLCRSVLFFS